MRLCALALLVSPTLVGQVGLWSRVPTTTSPSHWEAQLVYDAGRQVICHVGGQTLGNNSSPLQLWEFRGSTWVNQQASSPPTVDSVRAAYHSGLGAIVALAVRSSSHLEMYQWTGSGWSVLPGTPPPLRESFGLAYDAGRDRLVLFGGIGGGTVLAETWEWDRTDWHQVSSGGPVPRVFPVFEYDPARGVCVLFGGNREPSTLHYGDTWEWNGSYWFEHFGISGPTPRTWCASGFDPQRARMVVYGGNGPSGYSTETWEWDGGAWHPAQTQMDPGAGNGSLASMAYDPSGGRMIYMRSDGITWQYEAVPPMQASFSQFGVGCSGTGHGVPSLASTAGSLPRIGTTLSLELTNIPGGLLNLPIGVFGFRADTWNGTPLPVSLDPYGFVGCQAWIAPAFSQTLVNQGGTANWSIPIPFASSYLGQDFYVQGAVYAPGANPGGFLFSNAGHAVVGTP